MEDSLFATLLLPIALAFIIGRHGDQLPGRDRVMHRRNAEVEAKSAGGVSSAAHASAPDHRADRPEVGIEAGRSPGA
jgi:hypothetical protein